MKKEQDLRDEYPAIKRTTALIIAVICLAVGFLAGKFYSSVFSGDRKVRKVTVKQPASPAPVPVPAPKAGVISALEKEVAANPKNAEAWARLGHAYFDSSSFEKAIHAYKKHLELNPGNANVWTDMGVMYRRSGKPEEALRSFNKAIEIDPRHRQSRFNKGIVLMHDLKDPEAGVKAWEELVNLYPDARTQDGRPLKELVEKFKTLPGDNEKK